MSNEGDVARSSNIAELNRVSVKMPQFLSDDPELWLQPVDRSFKLSNVMSEDTNFSYVITSLEPLVMYEVGYIIMKPPVDKQYTVLKTASILLKIRKGGAV